MTQGLLHDSIHKRYQRMSRISPDLSRGIIARMMRMMPENLLARSAPAFRPTFDMFIHRYPAAEPRSELTPPVRHTTAATRTDPMVEESRLPMIKNESRTSLLPQDSEPPAQVATRERENVTTQGDPFLPAEPFVPVPQIIEFGPPIIQRKRISPSPSDESSTAPFSLSPLPVPPTHGTVRSGEPPENVQSAGTPMVVHSVQAQPGATIYQKRAPQRNVSEVVQATLPKNVRTASPPLIQATHRIHLQPETAIQREQSPAQDASEAAPPFSLPSRVHRIMADAQQASPENAQADNTAKATPLIYLQPETATQQVSKDDSLETAPIDEGSLPVVLPHLPLVHSTTRRTLPAPSKNPRSANVPIMQTVTPVQTQPNTAIQRKQSSEEDAVRTEARESYSSPLDNLMEGSRNRIQPTAPTHDVLGQGDTQVFSSHSSRISGTPARLDFHSGMAIVTPIFRKVESEITSLTWRKPIQAERPIDRQTAPDDGESQVLTYPISVHPTAFIQREETRETSTTRTTPPKPPETAAPDIEELVERILRRLLRQLAVESERRGLNR